MQSKNLQHLAGAWDGSKNDNSAYTCLISAQVPFSISEHLCENVVVDREFSDTGKLSGSIETSELHVLEKAGKQCQ